ncbi:hypothetical protein [Saccharopolyspora cebuensis]|uniref:Uncharacterized protein n=1 Tax=Saccharopolyspora cebuensis TaxID=418759 RepID=A0ABV4CAS0_9PSEU
MAGTRGIGTAEAPRESAPWWRRASNTGRRVVPARWRVAARDRRFAAEERPELQAFQRFYERLERKRGAVYLFVTGGLLHRLVSAERLVPRDVNLVLLGSGLAEPEVRWIRTRLDRPFHHIGLPVDANTAWEFLFATNRFDFGYVDADCLVLEPAVFDDLLRFDDDIALNAAWTHPAEPGLALAVPPLVGVHVAAVRELRRGGRYLSPAHHDWDGSVLPGPQPRSYRRVPTARQRRTLLEVLPADERGRPVPPGGAAHFDTLVAFQIGAVTAGYRTRAVRPLAHRPPDAAAASGAWQQDLSDELVHLRELDRHVRLHLAVEHALLSATGAELPGSYRARLREVAGRLAGLGVAPEEAAGLVRAHLNDRGVGERSADRVLGAG